MNKKKIIALILTVVMAMSLMTATAFAADISINGSGAGYDAYRLLNLTTSLKADHEAHEGGHSNDCYNYAYTVNPDYREMLQAQLGEDADEDGDGTVSDVEIIKAIEDMEADADALRDFANKMFKAIEDADKAADETASVNGEEKKFSNVPQGFYLIAESQRAEDPDAVSLVLLDTAGQEDLTVTAKEGVPTMTKNIVLEDGSLVDSDTVAKGDTVTYRLTITMPDNLAEYDAYKMIAHDDIQGALTLVEGSVTAKVDGEEIAFEVAEAEDDCDLELLFADMKAIDGISADSVLVIEYSCTVDEAVILGAAGNVNVAQLEFSADPYHANVTGFTTEDKTTVFSFGVKVSKVDDKQRPLGGANFKLQMADADGNYVDLMTSGVEAAADVTEFTFLGLDEGKYRLVETVVPAGFVEADPVEFEITAAHELDSADPALTAIVIKDGEDTLSAGDEALFTTDVTTGLANTKVINITGKRMPTTGGAGLAMLYACGAAMLAMGCGAVVVKKKAHKADAE